MHIPHSSLRLQYTPRDPHTGHQFLCVLEWFAFTLVIEKTSNRDRDVELAKAVRPANRSPNVISRVRYLRWLPAILPDSLFTVQDFEIYFAAKRIACDGISWALLLGSAGCVYLVGFDSAKLYGNGIVGTLFTLIPTHGWHGWTLSYFLLWQLCFRTSGTYKYYN